MKNLLLFTAIILTTVTSCSKDDDSITEDAINSSSNEEVKLTNAQIVITNDYSRVYFVEIINQTDRVIYGRPVFTYKYNGGKTRVFDTGYIRGLQASKLEPGVVYNYNQPVTENGDNFPKIFSISDIKVEYIINEGE